MWKLLDLFLASILFRKCLFWQALFPVNQENCTGNLSAVNRFPEKSLPMQRMSCDLEVWCTAKEIQISNANCETRGNPKTEKYKVKKDEKNTT